ncbi:MAG: BlaI/MecI/CopY family transcriptional regulator [Planctomycetota bacterium]
MSRKKTELLTDRETEIMSALWQLGSASAEVIQTQMSGDPHDSTVRTLLRVMVSKGLVVANKNERPTSYRASVRKRTMQKKVTRSLLSRFFDGSAEDLVLHLLENEKLSPQQLRKLQAEYQRQTNEDKAP